MERRRVRALSAHTEFVPGYGQVHFDPANPKEDVHHPLMPVSVIARLVANGWIADDLTATAGPLDHDGDGEKGGSLPHDPPSLAGRNKAELTAIAAGEGVALEDGMTNAAIAAAIQAHRDATVGGPPPA
jgi:hypothetical protein